MNSKELTEYSHEEMDAQSVALTIAGAFALIGLALLFFKKKSKNHNIRSVPPIIIKTGGYTLFSDEILTTDGQLSIEADYLVEKRDVDRIYYFYTRTNFGHTEKINITEQSQPYDDVTDVFGLSTDIQLQQKNAANQWVNVGIITIKNVPDASSPIIVNFVLRIDRKLTKSANPIRDNIYEWKSDPAYPIRISKIQVKDSEPKIKFLLPTVNDSEEFTLTFYNNA